MKQANNFDALRLVGALLALFAYSAFADTLVLGNSLTYTPASPALSWDHGGGMAASDEAHDFAHLLGGKVTTLNLFRQGFEGNLAADPVNKAIPIPTAEAIAQDTTTLDAETVVIVQLGDNVKDLAAFAPKYSQLLDALKRAKRLLCISTWWKNDAKDAMMKRACEAHGGRWVFIGDIRTDPANRDRFEKQYSQAAVNAHPHDWSMARIAERVLSRPSS